jgi:biopolymer transport protein ExbD
MKHRRRHAEDPLTPTLPITPMLDMAFQIFAFFVFTYHPSALEGQMELNLPAMGEAKAKDISQVDPNAQSDTELKLPSELTVVLHSQDSVGSVTQIDVQQREGSTQLNPEQPGELKLLLPHLKKVRGGLANQDDIKIQADSRVRWSQVVEVVDICKKAQFVNIGFGPPPETQ